MPSERGRPLLKLELLLPTIIYKHFKLTRGDPVPRWKAVWGRFGRGYLVGGILAVFCESLRALRLDSCCGEASSLWRLVVPI